MHQNFISSILLACGKEKVTIEDPIVLEKLRYYNSNPETKWLLVSNVLYSCHAVYRESPEYRESLKKQQTDDRDNKQERVSLYQKLMAKGMNSALASEISKNKQIAEQILKEIK
jgi:uncharacterized protein YoaH (UPF0181 family)